jgi:hypothetical protein
MTGDSTAASPDLSSPLVAPVSPHLPTTSTPAKGSWSVLAVELQEMVVAYYAQIGVAVDETRNVSFFPLLSTQNAVFTPCSAV